MYKKIICLLILLLTVSLAAAEPYTVRFVGVDDSDTLALLQSASQLAALQESPPNTLKGLRRRAEADISNILSALQSQAYYTAQADFTINSERTPSEVTIKIDMGPVYLLNDFQIILIPSDDACDQKPVVIKLHHLDITLGEPAYPEDILEAEEAALERLNKKGYPFARVEKRDVIVDQKETVVRVTLTIKTGPLAAFGLVTILGQRDVQTPFFRKKIAWCTGEVYSPKKIAKTQESLESSGLFRSVLITPADQLADDGTLPVTIEVAEAKHRSIGFGLNYMTQFGPGVTAEWQHRNFNEQGQRFSVSADLWYKMQQVTVRQVTPDFCRPEQNLIWIAEYGQEKTKGFSESYGSFSGLIERQLNKRTLISYGGMYKALRSERSDNNGIFNLLKAPMQLRWSNANNILDPTKGMSFQLKVTPTLQVSQPIFSYCITTFTGIWYHALKCDNSLVLANKLMLGSIFGKSRYEIPPPERFYAGSDSTLRGYHFMTVSPLNKRNDPIGGRSMVIFATELRYRFSEDFGCVVFYDIGNVYSNYIPELSHKQIQAVGAGIRYYTPIGPLRLDVAIPLNRRKGLDSPCQVYFSIGQAF